MKIFKTIQEVHSFSNTHRLNGKTIGLVPTMGALHQGHLDLVRASKSTCDISIATIFVNPAQFNNPKDLEKYPRNIHQDINLLEEVGCDALFSPTVDEIYQKESDISINLGSITRELEGKFRPGHFDGVALVVSKLFNIIQPNTAFFGQKDIQQYFVIKKLRNALNFPISLEMVLTKREPNGLAMSSRNERLNTDELEESALIYKALTISKQELNKGLELVKVKNNVEELFNNSDRLALEYFEAVDVNDFNPLDIIQNKEQTVLCIAAEIGNVRLIDNVPLFS